MIHSMNGIELEKAELRALLEFASKDTENPFAVVHFATADGVITAYATDGKRCVQAEGVAEENARRGEWSVFRAFLVACHKLIGPGQHLVLEVYGASLNRAVVIDTESGEEATSMTWPRDAASTQATIPVADIAKFVKLPTHEQSTRCVSVPPGQVAALALIGKAVGDEGVALDIYPPRVRMHPLIFRLEGPRATWTGAINPMGSKEDVEAAKRSAEDGS